MQTSFDRHITTEPDYGYESWCDKVWEILTKNFESPTQEEVNIYWDKFFEPLTIKLSACGTLPSGGCDPEFAAEVINRRWRNFKQQYDFLLEGMMAG
jgi:hypothetical protein